MKNILLIFAIFFALIQNTRAADEKEKELFNRFIEFTGEFEEDLHRLKQKPLVDLTEEEQKSVEDFSIERKINPEYIKKYEQDTKKQYTPQNRLNPWLATYYDPEYFMEYLEKLPARTLAQKYQLLVLWQIYKPEKVGSDEYKAIAEAAHNKTTEYLADDGNWQASWRRDEYNETINGDFQKCYADVDCLLKAIPYWMDLRIPMKVILPCDFAKAHNLLYYFDAAAGGSGTQAIMISTCVIDEKYNFAPELDAYIDNVIFEATPFSSGSIVNVFYAAADAQYWDIKYQPNFKADKIADWREFPYTEWAVQSYYNFKKFNSVINKGIGYKKAVDLLKKHYIKVFNAKPEQALNAALITLNPPSSGDFKRITSDNLNYLLLTGASWEKIKKQITKDVNPAKLLELSIAHPQNLRELVKLTKNVDEVNSFGKTPLQTAAQYGYLESVKILLEAGADINHQTVDSNCFSDFETECIHNGRRSALMYALQENQYETAKYLLDKGADITLTDTFENTALDYLMKRAPKLSTHRLGTIYGGEANWREPEDDEKLPKEQYNELYNRLFFHQQPQIAEVLTGKWKRKNDNTQISFEKNITNVKLELIIKDEKGRVFVELKEQEAGLLLIKDEEGVFAECKEHEDSRNVFNCIFEPDKGDKNKFDVYFAISHYYKDELIIYHSFEPNVLDRCVQDNSCTPDVLATLEREVEHDNE